MADGEGLLPWWLDPSCLWEDVDHVGKYVSHTAGGLPDGGIRGVKNRCF